MPSFIEVNVDADIEDLIESGGCAKRTLQRKALVLKNLNDFLKSFINKVSFLNLVTVLAICVCLKMT